MSTRYDVIEAKAEYVNHIGSHKCAVMDMSDPEFKYPPCQDRLDYWNAWLREANRWGREYGDDDRQRKQFFERNPAAIQNPGRSR